MCILCCFRYFCIKMVHLLVSEKKVLPSCLLRSKNLITIHMYPIVITWEARPHVNLKIWNAWSQFTGLCWGPWTTTIRQMITELLEPVAGVRLEIKVLVTMLLGPKNTFTTCSRTTWKCHIKSLTSIQGRLARPVHMGKSFGCVDTGVDFQSFYFTGLVKIDKTYIHGSAARCS